MNREEQVQVLRDETEMLTPIGVALKFAEEAGELSQALSKCIRYNSGFLPGSTRNNDYYVKEILKEAADVMIMLDMIQLTFGDARGHLPDVLEKMKERQKEIKLKNNDTKTIKKQGKHSKKKAKKNEPVQS